MQNSGMYLSNAISQPTKILVVDDHPNAAVLLARAISQLGTRVEVNAATSGRQALDCVQDRGVDILITDMDMPEMTGLELIERLRQHPDGGPRFSFLLTASRVPGLRIAASRLNVDGVLSKPIPPQQICQIVRMVLEEMDLSALYREFVSQKRFKILIADDDPDKVRLLSRYLDGEGYAYSTARNGLEALEQIRNESPDLILLDANVPHMDGFAVLQEIQALEPRAQQIPVIILREAWTHEQETSQDWNLREDDYVTQPIDHRELLLRIRKKLLEKEVEKARIVRKDL